MNKEIKYYEEKFRTKMNGSSIQTTRGWVEGIETMNDEDKTILLKLIINNK